MGVIWDPNHSFVGRCCSRESTTTRRCNKHRESRGRREKKIRILC